MKKEVRGIGFLGFIVLVMSLTMQASAANKKDAKAKPAVSKEAQALEQQSAAEKAKLDALAGRLKSEAKAREDLGAKEWTVHFSPVGDKKAKPQEDVLTFTSGKLSSRYFSTKGYLECNCTITVQDDGVIIWETMQVTKNGDTAFWKGELVNDAIDGIISLHPQKGAAQDFSFRLVKVEKAPEPAQPQAKQTSGDGKKEEAAKKAETQKKKTK